MTLQQRLAWLATLDAEQQADAIKTAHTARGHHWVKATLQSFDGSVQLTLDENGNVEMFAEEGSTAIPSHLVMRATLASLLDRARIEHVEV